VKSFPNWSNLFYGLGDMMGYRQEITPAQEAELRFLRQVVDRLQDERYRLDAHPNVQQDLFRAQQELKEFTSKLRQRGVLI